MKFSPSSLFNTLIVCAPFLSWGAAAFLIYQQWVTFNIKKGFSDEDLMLIFCVSVLAILTRGAALFRTGLAAMVSLLLLAVGVSGVFVLVEPAIIFPFIAWLGAVPAIVFAIRSQAWHRARCTDPEQPLPQQYSRKR
ncbi:hypothetical protein AYO42_06565 [Rhizomicrobium sp. SCGC AG-212-E05]|nr:hypothetical protein AYO42_06565 [Rhizomicrobium sp. SCGC AG-212-E05]